MTATENTSNRTATLANYETKIWLGIAVGLVVGIGISLSRRKKSRWDAARTITNRVTEHSGDLVDATVDMLGRVRNIFEESRKVVDGASHLWANGRKLVRY